jgi:hypothetical protein
MDDGEEFVEPEEKYQLSVWVAYGPTPDLRYSAEHWFVERPEESLVRMLLAEAKEAFAVLHPDFEPTELSTHITRLRPADNFRPDFRRLIE